MVLHLGPDGEHVRKTKKGNNKVRELISSTCIQKSNNKNQETYMYVFKSLFNKYRFIVS